MKSFALTALAAVASAQVVNTEGPETAIPAVTYESMWLRKEERKIGDVTMTIRVPTVITSTGTLGEYQIQDETTGEVTVWLWAQWSNSVSDTNFPNGSVVQNYAQWSSPTEPGKFDGFVCSAVYVQRNGTSPTLKIQNFQNSESINVVADGDRGLPIKQDRKSWDSIGTEAQDYDWFEQETDPALTNEYYGSTYQENEESTQRCGAVGMMFYQENGEDVEGLEEINEAYFSIKNAGAITFSTGFRIWENTSTSYLWAHGDAEQVSWSANDWGFEEPNAQVIVPDEMEMTESGAAALMAAATALTAFLMF